MVLTAGPDQLFVYDKLQVHRIMAQLRNLLIAIAAIAVGQTTPIFAPVHSLAGDDSRATNDSRVTELSRDAELNPWTKFGIGSWKKVRVFTEALNEQGKVESTSMKDTKTTLIEVTDTYFTLKVETTVEVAGKTFVADPNYVQQGYNGETNGQTVEIKRVGAGEIVIDGRKYASEIREVVINGDELKRVSLVHINELTPPHILSRETKATDAAGTVKKFDSTVEVIAVDMPSRVLSESKTVSHVKTTHRQVNGKSTVIMETHCADVPGSVVAHSAKELSLAGKVVSRETLELTEYHAVPVAAEASTAAAGRRRIFNRASRPRSGG